MIESDRTVTLNLRSATKALRDMKLLLDRGMIGFVSENLETLAGRFEEMADEQSNIERKFGADPQPSVPVEAPSGPSTGLPDQP